jgi:nitrite reductase/ring-hydroxylating ferredoxin subunit
MTRHVIAPVDELPPGTRKFLTIDARPIAVFNIKGEFFGLLNRCPHQGAALCEGPLIGLAQSSDPGEIEYTRLGEIIRCPWHGWEFDIRTGQSYCDPKRFRAKAYPVNVEPGSAVVKGPYGPKPSRSRWKATTWWWTYSRHSGARARRQDWRFAPILR